LPKKKIELALENVTIFYIGHIGSDVNQPLKERPALKYWSLYKTAKKRKKAIYCQRPKEGQWTNK
jgi:poly(3-hydroxyalkanoate) synthetase